MAAPDIDSTPIQTFLTTIKGGVDIETAAHYSEIGTGELFAWLERGKVEDDRIGQSSKKPLKREEAYLTIWQAVRTARAEAIARAQMSVTRAMAEDWKAAAWFLERAQPERFAKPSERAALLKMEREMIEGGENHGGGFVNAIDGATG